MFVSFSTLLEHRALHYLSLGFLMIFLFVLDSLAAYGTVVGGHSRILHG